MSQSDPHSPITTSRTLQTPLGHRIYTTTRDVAAEFPLPALGVLMSATNFVAGFTDHYILDVSETPLPHRAKRVTVTHGTFPTGAFTEYESQAYTFPPIYPYTPDPMGASFMPGGSKARQRVVPARIVYEYTLNPGASPTNWLAAPVIWDFSNIATGPFEVQSFIGQAAGVNFTNEDGSSGSVGQFLNPHFIGVDTVNNGYRVYSPGNLLYDIPASIPSASTYAGWVVAGTELMASRTIHRWYCGYMRRTAYVKAQ